MQKIIGNSVIAFSSLFALAANASCGSAMCMLNTNWGVQGMWTEPGARLDLRYEYIDQDQVLEGSSEISAEDYAQMHHREVSTVNRNLMANLDYAFDDTYGLSVNLPLISREHTHLHANHADHSLDTERWNFTEVGDVRLLGRMQLSSSADIHAAYGINLGLKLPTGDYKIANDEGEVAERSMQPGTGTTDAIVGAYYHHQLPELHSQWFTQLLFSKPLSERDHYRTGEQTALDLGYRYSPNRSWSLLAQFNYVVKGRDAGIEAEPEDSGARTLSFSPGVSAALSNYTQIYGFVHHRLYTHVNGAQLSAKDSLVVGVSTRF